MTNREAISLVTSALKSGRILQAKSANGEAVTCGPNPSAIPNPLEAFSGHRYGRSQWAGSVYEHLPWVIAEWFVQHVGRGAAGRAAKAALEEATADFQSFSKTCPDRRTMGVERRPANALNVEIGAPLPRCVQKRPEHWPASHGSTRWIASGGSLLVFGTCSQNCPRREGRS